MLRTYGLAVSHRHCSSSITGSSSTLTPSHSIRLGDRFIISQLFSRSLSRHTSLQPRVAGRLANLAKPAPSAAALESIIRRRTFHISPVTLTSSNPQAQSIEYFTLPMPDTPTEIIAKLPERFTKAREEGDLLFFPSTIHKHEEFGVEVCKSILSCVTWPASSASACFAVGDPSVPCPPAQTASAYATL
jgi:hypothetical protein